MHAYARRLPATRETPAAACRAAGVPAFLKLQRTVGNHALASSMKAPHGIQRKLLVDGDEADVAALIKLIGPPSGLELRHKGSGLVIDKELEDPPSPSLRARLKQIIGDAERHAQVKLMSSSQGALGIFGSWQQLWVRNAQSIEDQQPGAGVALAVHEIWENYESWTSGADADQDEYGPAHKSAVDVESATLTDIYRAHPSTRVAAATGGMRDPLVVDYESYFLLLTHVRATAGAAARFVAERRGRESVQTIELPDFARDSADLTTSTSSAIESAVGTHLKRKLATARVTGWRVIGEGDQISKQRAVAVRAKINEQLEEDDASRGKGEGAEVGSARAWSLDGGIRAEPGVTILIERPTAS